VLTETVNGKVRIQFESETLQAIRREARESQRRLLIGISGSGLLISGAVLLTSPAWAPIGGGSVALGLMILALSHRN
jgi:hypothetical protein